jgi:hypothetical protein
MGKNSSISGNNYEKKIYNIVKHCYINNNLFNTQNEEELGGSSSKNDIECNYQKERDIGIEVKKKNTPDWMQCSIKYNTNTKKWEGSNRCKIPEECRIIFNNILNNINLYNGELPPFINNSLKHEDWIQIKKKTNKWNDIYIDIPSDTISKLYKFKGCEYLQISDKGLYSLNNDICKLDVPLFNIEQQVRIRTKIHRRINAKGYCDISIIAACKPKNIKNLISSKYSLESKDKLPKNLIYKL